MIPRKLAALLSLLLLQPLVHAQQSQVVLEDTFANNDPLVNPGTGGNWLAANQGNATDTGVAHAEQNSTLRLASGTGGWNIGGIKSASSFSSGTTIEVVFTGLELVEENSGGADRGNGINTLLQGQISVADYLNQEQYPSGYKNDGKPALNVELQGVGGQSGFVIHRQGAGNNSSIVDHAGVFDSEVTAASPVTVSVVVSAAGNYTVSFSKPHDGGATTPFEGSLVSGFTDGKFIVALGNQGVNDNTGYALFDSIRALQPTSVPLEITAQPAAVAVLEGGTAQFSVSAVGTGTLRYQWRRNTADLPGQTNSTLILSNVTAAVQGDYSVVVTDNAGNLTSSAAGLSVRSKLNAFLDDFANSDVLSNSGQGGNWLAANQAEPVQSHEENGSRVSLYSADGAWNIGGIKTLNWFAAGTAFKVALAGLSLVQETGGRADRGNARLGTAIAAISLADGANSKSFPSAFQNDELAAITVEVVLLDAGDFGYAVTIPAFDGNKSSGASSFRQSGSLNWNGTTPLEVTVRLEANGDYLVRFSGTHDGGSTAPLLGNVGKTVDAVQLALGAQGVNLNVAAASFDQVTTVDLSKEPPLIGNAPESQTVLAGSSVTFSVQALGAGLTYQWLKDTNAISGATSSSFTIPAVAPEDAGAYSVIVSNAFGNATSPGATLTVLSTGVLFDDSFGGTDHFDNDGIGGDWIMADQGGNPDDGVDYAEASGKLKLPSSSGSWNIGGIKTVDSFPAGARVNAVLSGLEIVDGTGAKADRGNGISAVLQAHVSVTDASNQEAFPSAYKNDGKPAMNVEIQGIDGVWGFDIQKQGSGNNSSIVDHALKFDGEVSETNVLVISIVVDAAGEYSVWFNLPYDGGKTAPLRGSLGSGFAGGKFLVALGSQGMNENTGYSVFDRVQVSAPPVFAGSVVFEDNFEGTDLLDNGTWRAADQAGTLDTGLTHSEGAGLAKLGSADGGWNIGGIKTGPLGGTSVEVVFSGLDVVSGTDGPADRGNGIQARLQGQISVTDGANAEGYPSGYKNDGKPALNIEIQGADGRWGFDVQKQGAANNSSVADHAAVFDSGINSTNPLVAWIAVSPAGNYTVVFNKTYGGGSSAPLLGSLGAGFAGGQFLVALGSQGINNNTGYSLFDRVTVRGVASERPGPLSIRTVAGKVTVEWQNGVLQQSSNLGTAFADVANAASPYKPSTTATSGFFRLRK